MSAMTMEGIVTDIELRTIQKKDGSGELIIYDICLEGTDDKFAAFDKLLAERAFSLKGVPAILKVDIKQNGTWINRNLKGIDAKPISGFQPAMAAMEAQIGNGGGAVTTSQPSFFPEEAKPVFAPNTPLVDQPSYKDRSIFRQTAGKVSALISKTDSEFWENTLALAEYFETGARPQGLNSLIQSGAVQVGAGNVEQPPPFLPEVDSDIPF